jgi:hypothetical protein
VQTGRGVRQGCCLSLILFNLYSEYFTNKLLEGFGYFKMGHVICTVKCAGDLVLRKKQCYKTLFDRLIEIGRCCGMAMNVEIQIKRDQKQLENVEYLNCLGSMITNDARCTQEIKCRIVKAKAAFNKKTLFTSKLDLI